MVKEKFEVYKCSVCGNVVEVLVVGGGQLVCCGKEMLLQAANTVDAAQEKHLPVFTLEGGKAKIRIGEVAHPMTEEHYIMWIEALAGDDSVKKFLKPHDSPEAELSLPAGFEGEIIVRAYCNLHGLWQKAGE